MAFLALGSSCSWVERLEREGTPERRSAESARFSMVMVPIDPSESLPRGLEGTFEAEVVENGHRARLTMDFPNMRRGVPGPDAEFILVKDGPVYFRSIADPEPAPGGEEWIELEVAELSEVAPGMENFVSFLTNERFLTSRGIDEQYETGSATIRGVQTTGYTIQEDVDVVGDVLQLDQQTVEEMRSVLGDQAQWNFWVDNDGFVRRVEMPTPDPGDGIKGELKIRIDIFDFDGAFDVVVPDPSQVIEA